MALLWRSFGAALALHGRCMGAARAPLCRRSRAAARMSCAARRPAGARAAGLRRAGPVPVPELRRGGLPEAQAAEGLVEPGRALEGREALHILRGGSWRCCWYHARSRAKQRVSVGPTCNPPHARARPRRRPGPTAGGPAGSPAHAAVRCKAMPRPPHPGATAVRTPNSTNSWDCDEPMLQFLMFQALQNILWGRAAEATGSSSTNDLKGRSAAPASEQTPGNYPNTTQQKHPPHQTLMKHGNNTEQTAPGAFLETILRASPAQFGQFYPNLGRSQNRVCQVWWAGMNNYSQMPSGVFVESFPSVSGQRPERRSVIVAQLLPSSSPPPPPSTEA